jgi:hypothetical protein
MPSKGATFQGNSQTPKNVGMHAEESSKPNYHGYSSTPKTGVPSSVHNYNAPGYDNKDKNMPIKGVASHGNSQNPKSVGMPVDESLKPNYHGYASTPKTGVESHGNSQSPKNVGIHAEKISEPNYHGYTSQNATKSGITSTSHNYNAPGYDSKDKHMPDIGVSSHGNTQSPKNVSLHNEENLKPNYHGYSNSTKTGYHGYDQAVGKSTGHDSHVDPPHTNSTTPKKVGVPATPNGHATSTHPPIGHDKARNGTTSSKNTTNIHPSQSSKITHMPSKPTTNRIVVNHGDSNTPSIAFQGHPVNIVSVVVGAAIPLIFSFLT